MRAYDAEQIDSVDRRIRRTCFAEQRAYVFDPARYVSLLVGRGGGKTAAKLFRLLRAIIRTPNANALFIAATRNSAERLVWRDLKRVISDSLKLRDAKFFEADLVLELPNGSQLGLFGCDDKGDIQKLRGITYHAVEVDETASIKDDLLVELLVEVIGPRMIGSLGIGGTPGKRLSGMFYDVTRPGSDQHRAWKDRDLPEFAGWNKWSSHAWSIKDGVDAGVEPMAIIYAVQLETKKREGWSDTNPYWLREYVGQWAADETSHVYVYRAHDETGAEWNQWTPKIDAHGFAELPPGLTDVGYGIGLDVGWKDAFALEVFAFSYTDPRRTLWHVHEVYRTKLYANALAKMLIGEELSHDRYGGIIGQIGWPDVMVGDFAGAGGPLLKELQEIYAITIAPADKPYRYKENAIELFNADLFDGRVKIMKGSHLADEMLSLQWVVDQYGKRAENKAQANHATDSAMYVRNAIAPMLPAASSTPTAASSHVAPVRSVSKDPDDPIREPEQTFGDADAMYNEYASEW